MVVFRVSIVIISVLQTMFCLEVFVKLLIYLGGSTLEAMAKAVEESSLILIFFSEAYKNSTNCRAGKLKSKTTFIVVLYNFLR